MRRLVIGNVDRLAGGSRPLDRAAQERHLAAQPVERRCRIVASAGLIAIVVVVHILSLPAHAAITTDFELPRQLRRHRPVAPDLLFQPQLPPTAAQHRFHLRTPLTALAYALPALPGLRPPFTLSGSQGLHPTILAA